MRLNNKITVYIVEDYLLVRNSLKYELMKDETIDVIGDFENAQEFLDSFYEKPSDVVLLDLGLPDINGIETTVRIKKFNPKTKIIIFTSHATRNEILASLASGANAYCLKNIPMGKLTSIIKDVSQGAMWLHPVVSEIASRLIPKPNSTNLNNLYSSNVKNDLSLTNREKQTLALVVEGKSNTEIAKELNISANTAKAHVCNILTKLSVTDRVQAAVKAVRTKLLD